MTSGSALQLNVGMGTNIGIPTQSTKNINHPYMEGQLIPSHITINSKESRTRKVNRISEKDIASKQMRVEPTSLIQSIQQSS